MDVTVDAKQADWPNQAQLSTGRQWGKGKAGAEGARSGVPLLYSYHSLQQPATSVIEWVQSASW